MNILAIPTKYRGVEFKSRLEARFAEMLDKEHIDWVYEAPTYLFGSYQPDFYLPGIGKNGLFIEIKPRKFMHELQLFWDYIWASSGAWICLDKSDSERDGWVLVSKNSKFGGRALYDPYPTPVCFNCNDTGQGVILKVQHVFF